METDEVWAAAASPHHVTSSLHVRNGGRLTIEPCAVVLLGPGVVLGVGTPHQTMGTLIAEGTAAQPIHFRRLDPDRPWGRIQVSHPATARFAHVTMEGGGEVGKFNWATLAVWGNRDLPVKEPVFVDHLTILGSGGPGVSIGELAGFVPGSRELVVSGAGVNGPEGVYPVELEAHALTHLPAGSYVGNARDEIFITDSGSGIGQDTVIHDRGVPYRMGDFHAEWLKIGSDKGAPLVRVTIEPGVVIRFHAGTGIAVNQFGSGTDPDSNSGVLVARGTPEKPIVFTSAAAAPARGDWRGITFDDFIHPDNRIDHVRIEYAGSDCNCTGLTCSLVESVHEAAVWLDGAAPSAFITNTVFSHINGNGVFRDEPGDFVSHLATNTFDVTHCRETLPRRVMSPHCPVTPACPEVDPVQPRSAADNCRGDCMRSCVATCKLSGQRPSWCVQWCQIDCADQCPSSEI